MKNYCMNLRNKQAFTLVEIMIVVICMSLVIGPIFVILRSGSESSLKGMMRVETTTKARTIMKQIYADLKMSCYPIPANGKIGGNDNGMVIKKDYVLKNLFRNNNKTGENKEYYFYSYPTNLGYNEIFEKGKFKTNNNMGIRYVAHITYKMKRDPDTKFLQLIRVIKFKNKPPKEQILSKNVNFFDIKQIRFKVNGVDEFYYLITLQLIDTIHADNVAPGTKLEETSKNVVLADFFDVVYSDFFSTFWNDKNSYRNWHSEIRYTDYN